MKKSTLFLVGMAVLALSFGLVLAGCENGVQEVEGEVSINYPQVAAPSITAEKTTDGKYLILRWDAVENAGDYQVYSNQEGKNTILGGGSGATNRVTYKADGTSSVNSDSDKWNVIVPLTADIGAQLKSVRVGVQAIAGRYDGRNWYNSGIAWSGYNQETAHPYTALLGTWKKDGATAMDKQSFEFAAGPESYQPIEYIVRAQNGQILTTGYLSSSEIRGDTVSTSLSVDYYNNVAISIGTDGKLTVSDTGYSSYSYLAGVYVK
jgi:hypothetical protein